MGQYYIPVNVETLESVYSHDYGNGLKLMEHSFIGNTFVGAVMTLLAPGGKWHGAQIVWAGDYGELKREDLIESNSGPVDELIELVAPVEGENLNNQANSADLILKPVSMPEEQQIKAIVCNLDQKKYFRCDKLSNYTDKDKYVINPLPILTSDGNCQGGGDYSGANENLAGTWAGDRIAIVFDANAVPAGFEEIEPQFD